MATASATMGTGAGAGLQSALSVALGSRIHERNSIISPIDPACDDAEESLRIARAKSGDTDALSWLLTRYRPRVLRLSAGMLRGSREDAEDAAQDAFIRAFRGLSHYRADAPFSAWLYRITVRVCLDRRRQVSERQHETSLEAVHAETFPATVSSDPDAALLVGALLGELSPVLRAALILHEVEGLSYEETASVLQIPVGTVRSRLSAARARFRELWENVRKESDHV